MRSILEKVVKREHEMTVDKALSEAFNGKAFRDCWSDICSALTEADPSWNNDVSKSPIRNAVEWILSHKKKPPTSAAAKKCDHIGMWSEEDADGRSWCRGCGARSEGSGQ